MNFPSEIDTHLHLSRVKKNEGESSLSKGKRELILYLFTSLHIKQDVNKSTLLSLTKEKCTPHIYQMTLTVFLLV